MFDRMKIPLGKILGDHGPYAPYGMFDFEYRITLPQSKKILKAQGGEDKGEYKFTDLHLEYEIIESEDLVKEVKDTEPHWGHGADFSSARYFFSGAGLFFRV